jgi:hypothetical protein
VERTTRNGWDELVSQPFFFEDGRAAMKAWRLALAMALAWNWSAMGVQAAETPVEVLQKQIERAELFDFGTVRAEDAVEHTFEFRNSGAETLEVENVQLTAPLTVTKMTRQVRPGERASIAVRLGQPRKPGDFEGLIVVHFRKENAPNVIFRVRGRVVLPIDFEPMAAFFITTFKGESKQQSIGVTNYASEPLQALTVEHDSDRFTVDVATLEPGRRFRLTVTVKDNAPAGKMREAIRLLTSNELLPVIRIPVNTQVRERVYTFPDSIVLGLIDTATLKRQPQAAAFLSQSLMVYQKDGTDFQIQAETDVPFLRLTARQAQLKDRFEVQIDVSPDKLRAGQVQGSIRFRTNDPAFPRLEIPVTGQVNGDW